jgi:hypothetical protein
VAPVELAAVKENAAGAACRPCRRKQRLSTSHTSSCRQIYGHTSKKQTKQTAEEHKGKQIILFHNYTGGAPIATTQQGTQLVNERKTIGLSAKCIPQMKTSKYAKLSPIDEISMVSISKPASDFVASENIAGDAWSRQNSNIV